MPSGIRKDAQFNLKSCVWDLTASSQERKDTLNDAELCSLITHLVQLKVSMGEKTKCDEWSQRNWNVFEASFTSVCDSKVRNPFDRCACWYLNGWHFQLKSSRIHSVLSFFFFFFFFRVKVGKRHSVMSCSAFDQWAALLRTAGG